jgi:hypothetical protein
VIDDLNLGAVAAKHVMDIANQLHDITPVRPAISLKFKLSELVHGQKEQTWRRLQASFSAKCLSLYSFHLDEAATQNSFLTAFEKAKNERLGGLAYPRLNKPLDNLSADCLYVGTSRKTINRLSEHLGFGNDQTYSLHLGKWASVLEGGVEIRILEFEIDDPRRHLLTYLEDALARELRPMLGRRGNL